MEMWVNFCIYSTSRSKPPGQMMTGLRNGFQKLSTTVEIKLGNYSAGQRTNGSQMSSAKVHDDSGWTEG